MEKENVQGMFTSHLRAAGLASRLFDTVPSVTEATVRRIGRTALDSRFQLEVTVEHTNEAVLGAEVGRVRTEIEHWSRFR